MSNNNVITKKDASIAFILAVFVPTVLAMVLLIVVLMTAGSEESISLWLQYALTQGGILAAGLGLLFYRKHKITRFAGFNRAPKTLNIFLLAAISISFIFVMNPILNLWDSLLTKLGYVSKLVSFDFRSFNALEYAAGVLLIAIMPAFGEEIIFRGFVLNGLREKKFDVKAILISAALFTVMHKNVEQLFHPFVMGVVFGFIYCATESIWNTVILHFFNNLFTIVILSVPALGDFVAANWWLMFVGMAAAAGALYLIYKRRDTTEFTLPDLEKTKDMSSMFLLIAAIGYCLAVFVFGLF